MTTLLNLWKKLWPTATRWLFILTKSGVFMGIKLVLIYWKIWLEDIRMFVVKFSGSRRLGRSLSRQKSRDFLNYSLQWFNSMKKDFKKWHKKKEHIENDRPRVFFKIRE